MKTENQRKRILGNIAEKLEKGLSLAKATKSQGISAATYYNWTKTGIAPAKETKPRRKLVQKPRRKLVQKPRVIQVGSPQGQIFIAVGDATEVRQVLQSFFDRR